MIKLLAIGDLNCRGVCVPRLYPLERLTEHGYPVTVKVRGKYPTTSDLQWCDVLYFLRAVNANDLNFLKSAKALGKKLWIDTDDDLLTVPIDHKGYFEFRDETLRSAYIEIHRQADWITYSTSELRDAYRSYNSKCSIVPCAYADEQVDRLVSVNTPCTETIVWRGTETHEKSLLEFAPAIIRVAKQHPTWKFLFIGYKPWFVLEKITNPWWYQPFMDVDDLLEFINQNRPAVHMVARTDNQFTRSRSSISYVEATMGGATTVAPNWNEWRKPGVLTYSSKTEFVTCMDHAISSFRTKPAQRRFSQSVAHIKQHNTWKAVNKLHYQLLRKLIAA